MAMSTSLLFISLLAFFGPWNSNEAFQWNNEFENRIPGNCTDGNPCPPDATCTPVNATSVNCTCNDTCSQLIPGEDGVWFCEDMCSNSCLNGGICIHDATCDANAGTSCNCTEEYFGPNCQEEVGEGACTTHNCPPNSMCISLDNDTEHTCICSQPCYVYNNETNHCGDVCEDKCGLHGTCVYDVDTCFDEQGNRFNCSCSDGWTGDRCEVPPPTTPTTPTTLTTTPLITVTMAGTGATSAAPTGATPATSSSGSGTTASTTTTSSTTTTTTMPGSTTPPPVHCPSQVIPAELDVTANFTNPDFPNPTSRYNCHYVMQGPMETMFQITVEEMTIQGGGLLTVFDSDLEKVLYRSATSITAPTSLNETSGRFAHIFVNTTNIADNLMFRLSYTAVHLDACTTTECQHGGTCVTQLGRPKCHCTSCYTGDHCQNNIGDPCVFYVFFCAPPTPQCAYNNMTCSDPHCVP